MEVNQLIWILVVSVVICCLCLMFIKFRYFGNKTTFKQIISALSLLFDVADEFIKILDKDPNNLSIVEKISCYVRSMIKAAERLPEWNEDYQHLPPDELNYLQHQYVKQCVIDMLKVDGITVTPQVDSIIDRIIELCVALYLKHGTKRE